MKWLASIMWSILLEVLLKSLVWICNGFIFHIDIPTSSRMIYLSDGSCLCANHFCAMMLCVGATQNSIRVCQVHKIFTIELSFHLYFLIKQISFIFSPCFVCVLQWMLQIPGATSYMGCIGKDKFGEEMKKNSKLAGVNVSFFTSLHLLHLFHGYPSLHFRLVVLLLRPLNNPWSGSLSWGWDCTNWYMCSLRCWWREVSS